MKIIFSGTPEFALPSLEAILASPHDVIAVYTQPDRPQGRGLKIAASPIKQLAQTHNLSVYQPKTLRDKNITRPLRDLAPDIFIDVAYGLYIPEEILTLPRYGCINVHPSLLPRWRGASPIQAAILAGDKTTGISIIKLQQKLDAGDILKQREIPITDQDTTLSLSSKLAKLSADLLLETITAIETNEAHGIVQDDALSTHSSKINKEDAQINWNSSAQQLERIIRAYNPWPVAYTIIDGQTVRLWEAEVLTLTTSAAPGTIIAASKNGIDVATKDGILRLIKLQLPGKKVLTANEILNGHAQLFAIGKHITTIK